MEDRISLDHISTQPQYNLVDICNTDIDEDDNTIEDSPFSMITNTCDYYEINDVNLLISQDKNALSMFSLNCQGLRSHWDAFCSLMIGNRNSSLFDIIGITELYGMSDGECVLEGYHPLEFKTRSTADSSRGGVGIYVRNNLTYTIRQDLTIFMPNIFESLPGPP